MNSETLQVLDCDIKEVYGVEDESYFPSFVAENDSKWKIKLMYQECCEISNNFDILLA